jgi:hypothetical protein
MPQPIAYRCLCGMSVSYNTAIGQNQRDVMLEVAATKKVDKIR